MKTQKGIRLVCEYCNTEFEAKKATTRYCSLKCNNRAYKERKRKEVIQLTEELTQQKKVEKLTKDLSAQEYLSIPEVAILMGLSRWTIYRYVVDGKIPSKRFSEKVTRIKKSDLDTFFSDAETYKVTPHIIDAEKRVTDWYTLDEVSQKYGILKDQIHKIVKVENIQKAKDGIRTLVDKHGIDLYFKKKGFDATLINLAEWYTVPEISEKYEMTTTAVYSFVSKYKIPKKQQGGKRYYSKLHIDNLKESML